MADDGRFGELQGVMSFQLFLECVRLEIEMKGMSNRPKRLYNVSEAAEYLGCSSWSVRRLIWAGALPCVRAGRRVQVDLNDMDSFIEEHKKREGG